MDNDAFCFAVLPSVNCFSAENRTLFSRETKTFRTRKQHGKIKKLRLCGAVLNANLHCKSKVYMTWWRAFVFVCIIRIYQEINKGSCNFK